jgi:predicted kinase
MSGDMLLCGHTEARFATEISTAHYQSFSPVGVQDKIATPTLLFMAGFAGAGKTTLATWLHQKLQWEMLSKDRLKIGHLAAGEEERQAGWNAYVDLFELIKQKAIKPGKSVIIDASNEKPFVFKDVKATIEELAESQNEFHLKTILCVASKQVREKRISKRGSVFAPYVQDPPAILDDSELPERFHHLFSEDSHLLDYLRNLSSHQTELECFTSFSGPEALIFNTNASVEIYSEPVWHEIAAFLQEESPLSR